jgi:hypothetical protein
LNSKMGRFVKYSNIVLLGRSISKERKNIELNKFYYINLMRTCNLKIYCKCMLVEK